MSSIAELEDVAEAVELLAKVDWSAVPGDTLGTALAQLSEIRSRLDAVEADATGAFDQARHWMVDGSRSPGAWLAYRTRRAKRHHDKMRQRGRDLAAMPQVAEALAGGRISVEHLDALAWARARRPDHFGDAEAFLVDQAQTLRWRSFRHALSHWVNVVDPDDTDNDRQQAHDNRHLHASKTLDGCGRIDGWLEPLAFEEFHTALQRIEDELFAADWAAARAEHGDDITPAQLCRTPAQRRADAGNPPGSLEISPDGETPLAIEPQWDGRQTPPPPGQFGL